MTNPQIDWTVTWKFFHTQFFWIYLGVGILIRITSAIWLKPVPLARASLCTVASSAAAALVSTWFPFIPIVAGLILVSTAGYAAGYSVPITVPIVAVSLGLETASVDAVLLRLLLKKSVKGRLAVLLIINLLNAAVALAVGLAWAFRHMPKMIAELP